MFWELLLEVIKVPLGLIFKLIGLFPNAGATISEYAIKAFGWGCYMCGTPVISALLASILGWCTIFSVAGIFKAIKQYIPVA